MPRRTTTLLQAAIWAGLALCAPGLASAQSADPTPTCSSCFIGTLQLADNPDDPTGHTRLLVNDLYFVDPAKYMWKAGKGDKTDGASIPPLFQSIVGGPWEDDYLPAAVIHDHYTNKDHRVRPWRDVALVFYQAMIVMHTDIIKAKVMYYAVYAFGPHWDHLAQGVPCGANCVFSTATGISSQQPDYSPAHAPELSDVQEKIQAAELSGAPLSLADLEALAVTKHPSNAFLTTGVTR